MISPGGKRLCWPKEDRMPAERTRMREVRDVLGLKFNRSDALRRFEAERFEAASLSLLAQVLQLIVS
jgi:hypothetical protein